jgi:hypothetical protein
LNVVVINHLTLDGVMQAPGRAHEDTRGGFGHGGWPPRYGDVVMGEDMGARQPQSGAWSSGRRTYEHPLAAATTESRATVSQAACGRSTFRRHAVSDRPTPGGQHGMEVLAPGHAEQRQPSLPVLSRGSVNTFYVGYVGP